MISAADLMRWGRAGLPVPEEPIHRPAAPNFRGEEVHFVRYNDDGSIHSRGKMHREHVEAEREAGERIEIVADDHPLAAIPPPAQAFQAVALLDALKHAIGNELARTDRYMVADALDNIGAAEQSAWRAYRQALRHANKAASIETAMQNLPERDPRGADAFVAFRAGRESIGRITARS